MCIAQTFCLERFPSVAVSCSSGKTLTLTATSIHAVDALGQRNAEVFPKEFTYFDCSDFRTNDGDSLVPPPVRLRGVSLLPSDGRFQFAQSAYTHRIQAGSVCPSAHSVFCCTRKS
ncbi:unnamed protein product [Scytosiphon promiscuus]